MSKVWTRLCFGLDLCATTTSVILTYFNSQMTKSVIIHIFSPSYLATNHQFTLKITLKYNHILTSIASVKLVLKEFEHLKNFSLLGNTGTAGTTGSYSVRWHLSILIDLYSYLCLNEIYIKFIRKIFFLLEIIVNINYTTLYYRNGKRLLN